MDDGDVDAVGPELVGEVLGEGGDGDVAHAADGRARLARGHAADVDDAAPAVRLEVGNGGAGAAKVAEHLRVHLFGEVGVGDALKGRDGSGTAAGAGGVVHEDVEPPELLDGGRDHGVDGGRATGIADDGDDASAGLGGEFGGGRFQRLLRAGGDGDIDTLTGERARDRLADALAAAGDEGGLAFEFEVHG